MPLAGHPERMKMRLSAQKCRGRSSLLGGVGDHPTLFLFLRRSAATALRSRPRTGSKPYFQRRELGIGGEGRAVGMEQSRETQAFPYAISFKSRLSGAPG